jgi:hypothetical protein
MALRVCQAELIERLDVITAAWAVEVLTLKLYKSNTTPPVDGDVAGNYTECDFGGYVSQVLGTFPASSWVSPRATTTAAAQVFTASGASANVVYGYFVVDAGGLLVFAERNAAGGVTIGSVGQTYTVTPVMTLRSEF